LDVELSEPCFKVKTAFAVLAQAGTEE